LGGIPANPGRRLDRSMTVPAGLAVAPGRQRSRNDERKCRNRREHTIAISGVNTETCGL